MQIAHIINISIYIEESDHCYYKRQLLKLNDEKDLHVDCTFTEIITF